MKLAERRKKRREEAEARQKTRSKRTDEQQLAKLDVGNFAAKRERARLLKRIEKRAN
jgi:hypothetical protein